VRQIVSCSGSCRRTLCKLPCNVIDLGHRELSSRRSCSSFTTKPSIKLRSVTRGEGMSTSITMALGVVLGNSHGRTTTLTMLLRGVCTLFLSQEALPRETNSQLQWFLQEDSLQAPMQCLAPRASI
jgi:hypothetical protein